MAEIAENLYNAEMWILHFFSVDNVDNLKKNANVDNVDNVAKIVDNC